MSFNPASVPAVPYIGTPFAAPSNRLNPISEPARSVRLDFTWAEYGVSQVNPNAAATFNIQGNQARGSLLRSIRGVYIDNTASDGAVYVYFPDTAQMVPCAPFSVAWASVDTNVLIGTVIGKNFGTDDLSATTVFLYNVPVSPATFSELDIVYPQWRASPQLFPGLNLYTSGFASPAIGDQFQYLTASLNNINGTISQKIFGTPYLNGGIITLTDIYLVNYNTNGSYSGINSARPYTVNVSSNGLGGTYVALGLNDNPTTNPLQLFAKTGLQAKLNAAETWSFNVSGGTGGVFASSTNIGLHLGFSYQGAGGGTRTGTLGTLARPPVSFVNIQNGAGTFGGLQFVAPGTVNVISTEWYDTNFINGSQITAYIYTDVGGSPDLLVGASSTLTLNNPPFVPRTVPISFPFPNPVTIQNGRTYWVVLQAAAGGQIQIQTCAATAGFNAGLNNALASVAAGQVNGGQLWSAQITYQFL